MAINSTGNRSTPNSTPKLTERTVEVLHKYQQLRRDIELLSDFLQRPDPCAGVEMRIVACQLTCESLGMALAQMQVAALTERAV